MAFNHVNIANVKHISLKLRFQNSPTLSFVLTSWNIFQPAKGTIQLLPSGHKTTVF